MSVAFRLNAGDVLLIDDCRWTPVYKLDGGIALRPPGGGHPKPYEWSELLRLWDARRLKIDRSLAPGVCSKLLEDIRKDISVFSPEQRAVAHKRLKYVRMVHLALRLRDGRRQVGYRPSRTKKPSRISLKPEKLDLVAEVVGRFVEKDGGVAPCGTTLRNWYRRWIRCGKVYSALIPQDHRKGNRESRIHEIAANAMKEFAWKHYLQPEQPTANGVFSLVRDEIRKRATAAGMNEAEAEDLIPDVQAFYRVIRGIDEYDKVRFRDEREKADRQFRLKGKGPTYELPGEAVQIDSTQLPIVLQDPDDKLKFKHVTLTVVVDLATRAILGFYVGLEEGWPAIQQALRMAMLPKDWVAGMEGIKNPWNSRAKPTLAFTDQGSDYRSGSLVDVCAQLVVRLLHTPVGSPNLKGIIERLFRRVKEQIFAGMPGRLFKNGVRRHDYDAAKNAVLTMEQVIWVVTKFIADVYMLDWHDGMKDVPQDLWNERVEQFGIDLAPSRDALIPLICTDMSCSVQHTGIEWMGLFYGYKSRELQALLNRHGPGKDQYKVKIDPFDVGQAYVLHPDGHWIILECTDETAIGRTMHTHRVICHHAQKKKKTNERVRGAELDAARREIHAPAEPVNERRHVMRNATREARVRLPQCDPMRLPALLVAPSDTDGTMHLGVRDGDTAPSLTGRATRPGGSGVGRPEAKRPAREPRRQAPVRPAGNPAFKAADVVRPMRPPTKTSPFARADARSGDPATPPRKRYEHVEF